MMRFRFNSRILVLGLLLAIVPSAAQWASAAPQPKYFPTAEEAAAALAMAAQQRNEAEIVAILGPGAVEWIQSGDPVQDVNARARFAAAYAQKHAVKAAGENRAILEIGQEEFPFPFPLARTASGWAFDAEAGKVELLNRRIGENELSTVETLRAILDAQLEYASEDRDNDGLREYAAKFRSEPGQRDGLFWPTEADAPLSPVGELLAEAADEGYELDIHPAPNEQRAYFGYRYRILAQQAIDATGGTASYRTEGGMLGGFAILAYPAKYGVSGAMSFLINHEGAIYEADLGPETEREARAIVEFTTADKWRRLADDPGL